MKKNKLVATMLLFLIVFSNINIILATEISSAKLLLGESCGNHIQFKYSSGWVTISGNIIYYNANGTTYPAYCIIGGGTPGVDEKGSYTVSIEDVLDDVRVWRVIVNGYPYKTPSQMGVENAVDAYFATKQAIYSVMYNRDINTVYRGIDARGNKIVEAMKKLADIGRNGTQTPEVSNLTVTAVNGLVENGDSYYQEYKVTSSVDISEYTITGTTNMPTKSYIADLNGNKQTNFDGDENFKLVIPKSSMNETIENVAIAVQGKCKTYPVFYGKTPVDGWQDYAVTYDPYGDDTAIARLNVDTNTGSLRVVKTDKDTNQAINLVTFELSDANGNVLETKTTDATGIVQFNNLVQGTYKLKEKSTNENYILDTTTYDVYVEYDKVTTKELTNKHKEGSLSVLKLDKDNSKVTIAGVVFDLYSVELQKVIGNYTTDANGKIEVDNIRTGDYLLKEKSTNKWYNLAEDISLKINWNKTTSLNVANELKKSKVKVEKCDYDNNSIKLAGVEFEVLDENKNVLEIITTDNNGIAYTSPMVLRDYSNIIIREKTALSNYVLSTTSKSVELEENKVNSVTFTNELKKGQIKVVKQDFDNSNVKLKGVTFEIKDNVTGKVVETIVTNENGEATTGRLRSDHTYTVTETKTLDNYVLTTTPQEAVVEYNKTTTLTFTNELKKGQIKVVKKDYDNNEIALKGVTFEVKDNTTGKVVETLVTNENGIATTGRIRSDHTYTVTETKTLDNYVLTTTPQEAVVEYNKTTTLTFTNELKKGQIKVVKKDLDNNEVALKGVKFAIIDNATGKVVENIITNENGEAITGRIRSDRTYTVTETATLDNYVLNTASQIAIVEYNKTTTLNFTNELKKGQIKVIKKDFDNNEIRLAGITFEIKDNTTNEVVATITTDKNGEAITGRIRSDHTYTVTEVETLNNYVLNTTPQEAVVEYNKTTTLNFTNELKKGQIKVVKQDLDDSNVKLEGVTFEVKDNVTGEVVETIVTDKNGVAITGRIRSDRTYTVTETATLDNYVLNTTPQNAIVEYNKTTTLNFTNELKKGQIKIVKKDFDNEDVKLAGVTFEIKDNTTGKVVDTIVTGKDGVATTGRIRADHKYTVTEVATLDNYVLNTTPQEAEVKYNETTVLEFTNEKRKGQVKVIKVDYDDNNVKIEGVTFEIRNSKGEVVQTLVTDKNGEATSMRLPIDEQYTMVEILTLDNYVLDQTPIEIKVKENMIMKLSVTNEKIKGYIKIDKVSEEDNEYSGLKANSGLAGAEFEICDTEGNFITKVKTNENGEAITEQLLKGVYVIKELKAPDYYLPKDKVYFAEISTNGQISTIEITNQNVELDVSIEKNGYVETQDKDNIYYEFKNIANNSNVAVDNFTWSDELPTKALRLNQLYTGTWNEELEYGVWYKTNLKDEFVLYKDKLSTLVNNKIDFTTIKLADNEYVTDFEMRFGTVKAGFKQEEAPRVYCKMLDKLGNGFLFTNRTKVTATYINETLEARDVWNTVTYYKEIKINEELPKTGL